MKNQKKKQKLGCLIKDFGHDERGVFPALNFGHDGRETLDFHFSSSERMRKVGLPQEKQETLAMAATSDTKEKKTKIMPEGKHSSVTMTKDVPPSREGLQ